MKKIFLLLLTLLIIGCKDKTNEANINEVISFMIDKKAYPIPPPPSINDTTTLISEKVLDSLDSVRLKVAVYPTLDGFSEKEVKKIPSKYQNIFKIQNSPLKKIKINELASEKGHQIILADTIEMRKSKDFESFDLLFRFSNFYYSKDKQKVLFFLGVSQSRLAGSSSLYILKKENKKWKYEFFKELEMW